MTDNEVRVVVDPEVQKAFLYENGSLTKEFIVSTGRNGIGDHVDGSGKTPIGLFKVEAKYGDNAPKGAVFDSRELTGEVWDENPENPLNQGENAKKGYVLTRILWLGGMDEDPSSPTYNENTIGHYIYFHGTRNEDKLGSPNSAGCIVMSNDDIIDFYDRVPVFTRVEILNKPYKPTMG